MTNQFLENSIQAIKVGMLNFLQMLGSPNLRITEGADLLDAFFVGKRLVLIILEDTYG